jgi:hypothetical protein
MVLPLHAHVCGNTRAAQDGGFTNLVDQTGGWDGHTVAGLPVHKPQ